MLGLGLEIVFGPVYLLGLTFIYCRMHIGSGTNSAPSVYSFAVYRHKCIGVNNDCCRIESLKLLIRQSCYRLILLHAPAD